MTECLSCGCSPGWRCKRHADLKRNGRADPKSETAVNGAAADTSVTKTVDKSAGQEGWKAPVNPDRAPRTRTPQNVTKTCRNGHLMNDANTYTRKDGYPECRRCMADRARNYRNGRRP